MENFKIDLFEKETGELFPSFQKLNQTDCNICYQHFRKNIKVYDLHESVFDNFQSNGSFIEKYNALDDHFSLLELFADLNLCCDVICINWDEFKTIDVFRTIDLYNYFSDIWAQWKFSGDKHKSLQVDTERTFHQRCPLVML